MSFTPYPKQTNIILIAGVPLSPDYENTVKFSSLANQQQAFQNFSVKKTYTANSYQRAGNGRLRIAELADNLYRYNYLMFENYTPGVSPNYGNKWFYAFITDVIYINDHTTEVVYEIDVMQTFMFDYSLGMCYVEREHTITDHYGEHIVDEGLPVGDCLVENEDNSLTLDRDDTTYLKVYFYYVANEEKIGRIPQDSTQGFPISGDIQTVAVSDTDRCVNYDGNYMGVTFTYLDLDLGVPSTTRENISKVVQKLLEIGANIVSIEMRPTVTPFYAAVVQESTEFIDTYDGSYEPGGNPYTPKNKKLYSYPYKYVCVSNNQGQCATYRYEDFTQRSYHTVPMSASFTVESCSLPKYTMLLRPSTTNPYYDYKKPVYDNSLKFENTRSVVWSEDSFAKWWQENKSTYALGVATQIINGTMNIIGAATGASNASAIFTRSSTNTATKAYINAKQGSESADMNLGMSGIALAESIMGDVATYASHKATPDNLGGNISNDAILNTLNRVGFCIYQMGLRARDAKIIDDYFTRFGYAIKRVKLPNIEGEPLQNLRPHWNYIKTKGAAFSSDYVPAYYANKIRSIYDTGITFWLSMSEVGNYSLDNSV